MNKIKFTDWQNMALKKDTEAILKKLNSHEPIFFSLCWEIVIAIGVVIVDHLFDTEKVGPMIWIIVAGGALLPAIIILLYKLISWSSTIVRVKRGNYSIRDFINTFDNNICNFAMTSDSYCHLLDNLQTEGNQEKVFLYQEGCYYNNKAIQELYKMKPVISKVFSKDINKAAKKRLIALYRLESLLQIMRNNENKLNEKVNNFSESAISSQKEMNIIYADMINSFINDLNQIFQTEISLFTCD